MKSNLKTHLNNYLHEDYADICISANDTYAVLKKDKRWKQKRDIWDILEQRK